MTDTLVLVGYGSAMILGFASVVTILFYGFTRGTRYEYTVKPQVEVKEIEDVG